MARKGREKLKRSITNREYKIILLGVLYPHYWDDGIRTYPRYRKGFKNPNRQLFSSQIREYRTWKYNRMKQYK